MGNDNDLKIYLGVELEKNSKTTLDQEIKKLTENGIKLQIGLDKQSLTALTTSIDNITKQLQSMGSMGSNATREANRGFEQTAKKAKDYAEGLSILTEQYKKGAISAKEYFDGMNSRMLNKNGELNKYNNQLDPSKLQEYLTLLSNIQSRIGEVKPIGDLISSKTMSTISNGFTEVVQKVDTYTDRMGKVQHITSIVNKNTGELIASYERVTNSSEKYETSIERQKTSMEKLKNSIEQSIAEKKWIRLYYHPNDTLAFGIEELLDFINEKVVEGSLGKTTWKNMFDKFSSSKLEKRIADLEAKG